MTLYDSGEKITEEMMAQFEKEIGYVFPPDYKAFMLSVNGGTPEEDLAFNFVDITNNKGNSSDLRELFVFYMGNNTNYDDIIRIYKSMVGEQCIPAYFLPIGDDSGGNPICMSLSDNEYGAVFFCDHELENKETGFLAASKIADSFTEFIKELYLISQ